MTEGSTDLLAPLVGERGLAAVESGRATDAFELATVDEAGWPHIALLSPGEVLLVDGARLAFCLWPGSSTSANLAREGRALLQAVTGGTIAKIRLRVESLGEVPAGEGTLAGFVATLEGSPRQDAVPYAEVLDGIRYRLPDPAPVVERWGLQLRTLGAAVESHDSAAGP